ncbi:uncharacterized protein LOC143793128 [Ranitomeya variabilis]|uniref:uncharacterized protein LOC143793108 n=1 Tax=Ranitomeya variabilis TaxID=490064 RepID=UPI0040565B19
MLLMRLTSEISETSRMPISTMTTTEPASRVNPLMRAIGRFKKYVKEKFTRTENVKLDTKKKRRLTKSRKEIIKEMQERWEKEEKERIRMEKTLEETTQDEMGKTTTLIIYETSV